MKQPEFDSDFENYRREKIYRRRQRTQTERPGGNSSDVWVELEAAEEGEIKDQILTREVHDFFNDATKIAANIVSKVSEERKEEVTDRMRQEMEDFLRETIRRASSFISVLGTGDGRAEATLEPDMHNLVGNSLDEFREEGTASLHDKHIGQDPFDTDLDVLQGSIAQNADEDSEDELLSGEGLHLSDPELELQVDPDSAAEELPMQIDEPSPMQAKELSDASVAAPEAPVVAKAQPTAADLAMNEELKNALRLLVRQGIMTKDQARAAYASQRKR